jgi:tetratricopeptide (TPR) repeat protein
MSPDVQHALQLHRSGQLEQAETIYRAILKSNPLEPICLHFLGVIRAQRGSPKEALSLIAQAIAVSPNEADFYFNRARILETLGRWPEARADLEKTLSLKPASTQARLGLGRILCLLQQHTIAIHHFQEVGKQRPLDRQPRILEAQALFDLRRYSESLQKVQDLLDRDVTDAEAWLSKSHCLIAMDLHYSALAAIDEYLSLANEAPTAVLQGRAGLLTKLGRRDEAASTLRQALQREPLQPSLNFLLGNELQALGDIVGALQSFNTAFTLQPDFAQAEFNASVLQLLTGDFKNGWRSYEARWRLANVERHIAVARLPITTISDRAQLEDKRVYLQGEQGAGDDILFASMLRDFRSFCRKLTVGVDARIQPLLARSFPDIDFIPNDRHPDPESFDVIYSLGSIGTWTREEPSRFEGSPAHYLSVDQTLRAKFKTALVRPDQRICAFSWKSQNPHTGPYRSIDLAAFLDALPDGEHYRYVNLQFGTSDAEWATLRATLGHSLIELDDLNLWDDLESVAAILANCDVVVAVGNTVANLACALGIDTLVLCPVVPTWRWSGPGEKCFWYPSATLLRQSRPNDWRAPLSLLRKQLRQRAGIVENATSTQNSHEPDEIRMALALERAGDLATLLQLTEQQLERNPTDDRFRRVKITALFASRRYREALEELSKLSNDTSGMPEKLRRLARWDGRQLDGTLIVLSEPHLGEEILFSKLLNLSIMKRTHCLVEIDGRLLRLFRRSFPHVRFVARGDDALAQAVGKTTSCRIATFAELLTIALNDSEGLPSGGWLKVDEEAIDRKRAQYASKYGPASRVGLSWRSRRFIYDRDEKSIEPQFLAAIFQDQNANVIDFQYGEFFEDRTWIAQHFTNSLKRDPELFPMSDLDGLATALCALDRLITVSNSTAHLAGALGVPTTIVLPMTSKLFWHWDFHLDEQAWYPHVTAIGLNDLLSKKS